MEVQSLKSLNIQGVSGSWVSLGSTELTSKSELVQKQFGLIRPTISSIAEDFARIELGLYKEDEKLEGLNPAWLSLSLVNDGWTMYELFEAYATYMLLLGENIWYVPAKEGSKIREIYILNPLNVKERTFDDWGNMISFEYQVSTTKTITYSQDEFIHTKSFNAYDIRYGFVGINGVASAVEAAESAFDYNRKFFQNDATPSLLIKVKKQLTEKSKAIFKANWLAQFRGKDKAHKFALADGDMEVEKLSMSNRDMEFKALMDKADERVLSNWKMNKVIIGQTEGVNRATVEGAEYIHASRVLDPMFRKFMAFLNEKYLPLFYKKEDLIIDKIRFEYVSPIKKDLQLLLQIATAGVGSKPFMSINEARTMMDLAPLDDNKYDEIPEREPYVLPEKDTSEVDRKMRILNEQNMELKEVVKYSKELEVKKKELREVWRKEHIKRADRLEPTIARDINGYFKGLKDRMKEAVKTKAKKAYYNGQLDPQVEKELFRTAIRTGLQQGMLEGWASADSKVTGTIPYAQVGDELNTFLIQTLEHVSGQTYATTEQDFAQLLEEATIEGWSVDELAEKIDGLIESYYNNRATTIARTELNKVVSGVTQKRFELAEKDGVISGKEWLAELDDKTRPWHAEADGQVVKVNGKFNIGGEMITNPGEGSAENSVNCRCTIIPVL